MVFYLRWRPLIASSPSNIGGVINVDVCLGAGVSPSPPPQDTSTNFLKLFLYSPHSFVTLERSALLSRLALWHEF
jgi:hypothetical protein